jgi:hypothetical protein
MPRLEFERTIPVVERAKTVHTSYRATTVIGLTLHIGTPKYYCSQIRHDTPKQNTSDSFVTNYKNLTLIQLVRIWQFVAMVNWNYVTTMKNFWFAKFLSVYRRICSGVTYLVKRYLAGGFFCLIDEFSQCFWYCLCICIMHTQKTDIAVCLEATSVYGTFPNC